MRVDFGNCDEDRIFDQVQHSNALREREQREKRQAAEVEMLDADIDFREYRKRRAAKLIVEPGLPLEELTFRDYRITRDNDLDTRDEDPNDPVLLDY